MGFGGDDFFGSNLSLGQAMFMGEEEGVEDLVDSDDTRFNAAMKQIRSELAWSKGKDIYVTNEVNDILWQHGISPGNLTRKQVKRIENALA